MLICRDPKTKAPCTPRMHLLQRRRISASWGSSGNDRKSAAAAASDVPSHLTAVIEWIAGITAE